MSVRSRGQLLAGFAAVLGVCTAGSGCQSHAVRQPTFAAAPAAQGRAASAPVAAAGTTVSRQVQLLRPVSASGNESGVVVSAYLPAERVGPPVAAAPTSAYVARTVTPLSRAASDELPALPPPVATGPVTVEPVPGHVADHGPGPGPVEFVGHHGYAAAVPDVPKEFMKRSLPVYVVEPPDILLIRASPSVLEPVNAPLDGQHLVRPDGSISLGVYGDIWVAGQTLEQIRDQVAAAILRRTKNTMLTVDKVKLEVTVDVLAYNSKVFYVITDGAGYGAQVFSLPVKGNETVLDAISAIGGLPQVASKKKIWLARATPDHSPHPMILPVNWCAIAEYGSAATNYQIFPGDRLYVQSDPFLRVETVLNKVLNPVDRIFGTVLLGSTTVNSIRTNGKTSGGSSTP